jgi:lysozyme family protein
MDNFPASIVFVLAREGGYVHDPVDAGGETNFGISKRAYPDLDIKSLTRADAEVIYRRDYWVPAKCDQLPWPLALCHFDAAVNHGVGQATRFLAKSNGQWKSYLAERRAFYERLIARKPSQEKFRKGWMRRLDHLEAVCQKA